MRERMAGASPGATAKAAGIFYLFTFVTGIASLMARGSWAVTAMLAAAACYVAVTVLFYYLFKPVHRSVSLAAAVVSLAGCAASAALKMQPLAIFGVYCLTIGWLILRSTFLPRVLGILMVFAGAGWLTYVSAELGRQLYPYNLGPGIIGEGALTVWLLVRGVDAARWREQAGAASGRSQALWAVGRAG